MHAAGTVELFQLIRKIFSSIPNYKLELMHNTKIMLLTKRLIDTTCNFMVGSVSTKSKVKCFTKSKSRVGKVLQAPGGSTTKGEPAMLGISQVVLLSQHKCFFYREKCREDRKVAGIAVPPWKSDKAGQNKWPQIEELFYLSVR